MRQLTARSPAASRSSSPLSLHKRGTVRGQGHVRGESMLLDETDVNRSTQELLESTGRSGYRGYRASRNEGSQALQFTHPFLQRGEDAVASTSHALVRFLCGARVVAHVSPRPTRRHQGFSARSGLVPSQGHVGSTTTRRGIGRGASAEGLGLGFRLNGTDRCRAWPRPPWQDGSIRRY